MHQQLAPWPLLGLLLLLALPDGHAQPAATCSLATCNPIISFSGCAWGTSCGRNIVRDECYCPSRMCSGCAEASRMCKDATCTCAQPAWVLPLGSKRLASTCGCLGSMGRCFGACCSDATTL